ncbi:hypothetical protein L0663_19085 [Dyadobacter sp. CY107]|uniref:DUF3244 domain-containing protein n=1 Tax=Dyadobacter fanqingshengii TaxID=2906443 RepID=UPI001F315F65|nr:hypothetical protein [Dyadobacter fanqingshengii]MCF2505505.1 hypothetical protein [Dyadobacter fanqingshengii]
MKTILKVFACYFFLQSAAHAKTSDDVDNKSAKSFESVIYPLKDGRLRINITNARLERMVVIMKNEEGVIIQKNFIDKKCEKAGITYDVSNLERGKYKIYIRNKKDAEIKDFNIEEVKAQHRFITMNVVD